MNIRQHYLEDSQINQYECDQIIHNYQKALEQRRSSSIKAANDLSRTLSKNGDLSSAMYIYQNIAAGNSNNSDEDYNYYFGRVITQISLRTGQFEKAISFFEDALSLQPNNSWLHYYLAVNLANDSQTDQALEKYLHIISKDDRFFPAYVQLGIILLKKDNLEKAIKYNIEAFRLLSVYSIDRRLIEDLALSNQELLNKGFIQNNRLSVESLEEMRLVLENAINKLDHLSHNTVVNLYYTISKILKSQGKLEEAVDCSIKASYYKARKVKPDIYTNKPNLVNFDSPSFLIIGVKKCGTTSLYDYLMQHPQMLPASIKEPQFITQLIRERRKGNIDSYQKLSESDLKLYLSLFPPHPEGEYLTGEASTTYMWYPGIEKVIFNSFPKLKLIILLRNPVKRVISEYNFQVDLGRENRSLEEMVNSQLDYLESLPDISEITKNPRFDEYLVHSLYVYFIQKWLSVFPKEQLLILKNEDLSTNQDMVMNQTFNFLNLPPYDFIKYSQKLRGYYPQVDKKISSRLTNFFKPHNQKLEKLLDIELNWD